MQKTSDLRIRSVTPVIRPRDLVERLPITETAAATVVGARQGIKRVLAGRDRRLLAVVGPCSIHDCEAALEYARRLRELQLRFAERLLLLMRVYFEKPRTTVGWRGLIIDPHLNGSYDIAEGLALARRLLLQVNELGLPAATEMLDPIVPQYLADLISWAAIGARTTESQTHRNMVSGLSFPVGFKNSTDGNLHVAVEAMAAAREPHHFMGIDPLGQTAVLETTGNTDTHIILRGSRAEVNYRRPEVVYAAELLREAGFRPAIMVDCSHGNSDKQPERQEQALRSVLATRASGCRELVGFMLESNLRPGRQSIPQDLSKLQHGVSVTDACIGWEATDALLQYAFDNHKPKE